MKVKQKSIRAFEFTISGADDEKELISYVQQNLEILKSFLISINGELSKDAKEYLKDKRLKTVFEGDSLQNKNITDKNPVQETLKKDESNKEEKSEEQKNELINYDIPIRSGNRVECDNDVAIFKRINSGAKVIARKNAIIFGTIDGDLEANGDYLILKDIGKGNVVFNGEEVKKDSIDGRLCKIVIKKGLLVYEEL